MMFVSREAEENLIHETLWTFLAATGDAVIALKNFDFIVQTRMSGWDRGFLLRPAQNRTLFLIKDKLILYYSDFILPLHLVL